jgi:lipid-A-disaccharide synthase
MMSLAPVSNCLILAGEKSGEEHALGVWSEILRKKSDVVQQCHFWGVGGDQLRSLGVETIYDLKEFSSMGFSEVIGKIPFYWGAQHKILKEVERRNCKVAWLIDFQDFNLRLAQALHKRGVKVLYYVAPQAWAWRSGRVKILAKTVHRLFTILPFENSWFTRLGMPADKLVYVGHPLSARLGPGQLASERLGRKNIKKLLILPGSRKREIIEHLPTFCSAIDKLKKKYPDLETHLVRSLNLPQSLFENVLSPAQQKLIDHWWTEEQLSFALKTCDFALATSGTITLITGLFSLPTVVCYRTSLLNEWVFNTFIRYPGAISLTNLVAEQSVFPELIQEQMSAYNIETCLDKFMNDRAQYNRIVEKLLPMPELLQSRAEQFADNFEQVMLESYGQRL